jgi:hypothetical protein
MNRWTMMAVLGLVAVLSAGPVGSEPDPVIAAPAPSSLTKMTLYLTAGDYRRAFETCQRNIDEAPSAATYIHLTYVYHAIDAYLEHLSKEERWMAVEHLYLNLATRGTEDLVDPPGGLARMVKEMIQLSVRQQSDVSAAMANRLDKAESDRLWIEQTKWRAANPQSWWQSLPPTWIR